MSNQRTRLKLEFDKVLFRAGEFGKYQKVFFFLLCLPVMFCASTTLLNSFAIAKPPSRCFVHGCDTENSTYQTAFTQGFANFTIPYQGKELYF